MNDGGDRPFVDTNVLIYLYDRTAGEKHARALDLMGRLTTTDAKLCTSAQVLEEFFVNATRKLGLDADVAGSIVADLTRTEVHAPRPGDVMAAIDIYRRHQISFWDAMIVRSASQLGCDVLWTEDLAHGRNYEGVLAHNPFA